MKHTPAVSSVQCYAARESGVESLLPEAAAAEIRNRVSDSTAAQSDDLIWIDITHPTEVEAAYLRDLAGMHPLAVEDCLRGRQRPKLDRYPGYFFLVFYAVRINPARARMALNEIHIFLGTSFLITVHDQPIGEVARLLDSWRENTGHWIHSAAVAHAVLDSITDNYFPLVEYFSTKLEVFEDEVFMEVPELSLERVARVRQELIHFRRILGPERDVMSSLVRRDLPFVSPDLVPYFQDVHDHILRATEEIDSFRDLLAGLIEIQSSNTAKQLNRTMRTLTVWSIILMSMALIAGIYGMNFDNMPELNWRWGYFGAIGFMLVIGSALLVVFRRRHWL